MCIYRRISSARRKTDAKQHISKKNSKKTLIKALLLTNLIKKRVMDGSCYINNNMHINSYLVFGKYDSVL